MSVFLPSSVRVLNDVPVPMRDHVHLSADVYQPNAGPGPWPVLLSRTPYDNNLLMDLGFFLAQQGYVYVAQDVRGRYDSEGRVCALGPRDGRRLRHSGMDRAQPWCDGNVGMTGGSYPRPGAVAGGHDRSPLLKTIVPRVMGNNLWDSPHYQGGAFGLGANAVWGWRTMGRTMQRIDRMDWPAVLRTLPLRAMDEVSGKQHPAFATWLDHHDYDDYWRSHRGRRALRPHHDPRAAGLRLVRPLRGRDDGELRRSAREQAGSASWPAPTSGSSWVRGPTARPASRPRARPTPATAISASFRCSTPPPLHRTRLVRPLAQGHRQRHGRARFFSRNSSSWVLMSGGTNTSGRFARTVWTPYYLHSDGHATNTLRGDGTLSPAKPGEEPADHLLLRPRASGPDDGRLQLLQSGDRALGRLRPAADRGARRRARLHHASRSTQDRGGHGPDRRPPLRRDRRPATPISPPSTVINSLKFPSYRLPPQSTSSAITITTSPCCVAARNLRHMT